MFFATKNFNLFDIEGETEIMIGCRDREVKDAERWVLVSLTENEARDLFEILKEKFEKG